MAGIRAANASNTVFFIIPRTTASDRPMALLPTLIRWWEWLRATGNASSKYVGGAEGAGWEALLAMETMDLEEGRNSIRATWIMVDLAKVFQKVQLNFVWKWAMCCVFPQTVLRALYGYFAHERLLSFENNVSEPMSTITALFLGSQWSVLLSRIVTQDAMRCVFSVFLERRISGV